jgi:putative ABC transport system ATP-binding protein
MDSQHRGVGLEARDLVKSYGSTGALQGASVRVEAAESLAIMGASGSGKSTLLHCLAGIELPDAGSVWFNGEPLSEMTDRERSHLRLRSFGFVFQFADLVPELTLAENIALPLELLGMSHREVVERVNELVALLGLDACRGRLPSRASGGERQRAAVARAVAHRPTVVFADEPTGALDSSNGAAVLDLLLRATEQARSTLVIVTHDPAVAAQCGRIVMIRDGVVEHSAGTR